jgi:hypothetical protein
MKKHTKNTQSKATPYNEHDTPVSVAVSLHSENRNVFGIKFGSLSLDLQLV